MTEADIVEFLYERFGFARKECEEILDPFFEIMKEILKTGKSKISGFGSFIVRRKRPRKGRNPQTGEEMLIAGRRVLTFKPGLLLRNEMAEAPP